MAVLQCRWCRQRISRERKGRVHVARRRLKDHQAKCAQKRKEGNLGT